MKVWTTLGDGIDNLILSERATPAPRAGEVLLKMRAASLNYRDLLVTNGVGAWKPPAARVPLSDGVGEIVAVGAGVTQWRAGARVAGIFLPRWTGGELTAEKMLGSLGGAAADGVLAEYVAFPEDAIVEVPPSLTDEEAATLPCAAVTAWHAVAERCRVGAGETVLIQGTGGVSLFALQFAAARGARPLVTSSSDRKLEKARRLGAEAVINYRESPDWDEKALALTDGLGVDTVVEVVGGENLNRSLNAVRTSGSIAFIGLIAGLSAPINTYQFVVKNVRLHGIETGSREMFAGMNEFIETNRIKPVIDRSFGFDEIADALRYLESGSHFGKIVVKF
jgi:NADPH:quinone reductase-like Zn-dependent oxidoreductase